MSDEMNIYYAALESLPEYEEELREAFKKRAGKSQKINNNAILDMLNDVSVILAFDCENAKYFFSQSNRDIPQGYDLNSLKFNEFIELFRLWLEKEAEIEQNGDNNEENQDIRMTDQENPGYIKGKPVAKPPRHYAANRKLMDDLLRQHLKAYQDVFRERLIEEDQTEIAAADIFIFLQECFYMEEVEVRENEKATDDFFRKIGSYKIMFKLMEKYLSEGKLAGQRNADIYSTTLKFDECMDFLDYWLRSDENLILVDNRKDPNEGAVRKALEETIAKYEKMIESSNNEEEKELLGETIQVLKGKLRDLDGRGNQSMLKDGVKSEDRKLRALKEIFDFYCTQQINTGKFATFEKVKRLSNTINLGTYRIFLKNFRLKINHMRLVELYKKSAGIDENLDYEEFLDLMNKVALRAEIAPEAKVVQPHPEVMKSYRPDTYKHDDRYKLFKQNDAKKRQEFDVIKKAKKSYAIDDKKRDEEKLEEIWDHMGLYTGDYRDFIGKVGLPFNSHDHENFRIPPDSLKYRFRARAMEGKTVDEVKEEVQRRNHMRSLVKDLKNAEKEFMAGFRGSSQPVRTSASPPSLAKQLKEEDSYSQRQNAKSKMSLPQIKKLTMKKLGHSGDGDLAHLHDRFNPYDLIDENDDEDDMYLAEYGITPDRKKVIEVKKIENRKSIEQYGKLKKVAKGFARNGKYAISSARPPEVKMSLHDIDTNPSQYMPYAYSESRISTGPYGSPKGGSMPQSVRNMKGPISHPTYLDHQPSPRNGNPAKYSNQYDSRVDSSIYSSRYQGPNEYTYNNNGYYRAREPVNNSGYYQQPKASGYYSTLDRASQIEMDTQRRENQLMNNAMNIHNNQVNRGLKSIRK